MNYRAEIFKIEQMIVKKYPDHKDMIFARADKHVKKYYGPPTNFRKSPDNLRLNFLKKIT